MAAYPGSTAITTELIQKYLDENKQLILAILDNQNLGKLNECAQYQLKLQQNLMYLAAIADAQPQPPLTAAQVPPSTMMQPGQHYMQQQQQQQQQHMMQQSMLGQRNPMQYMPQAQGAMHPAAAAAAAAAAQQQAMAVHAGMVPGAHNGWDKVLGEGGVGGNGPAGAGSFADFGRGNPGAGGAGDGLQTSIGLGGGNRSGDMGGGGSGGGGAGGGDGGASGVQGGDDTEPSYLKASEEDGN